MADQNPLASLLGIVPAVSRGRIDNTLQSLGQYGLRENSTMKGAGYFGTLLRKDGGVSTELSAGFDIDGKEMDVPLLVPTLNTDEIQWLLNTPSDSPDYFQAMPPSILDKAYKHAVSRLRSGKSPFAD
jgi:hypothetical protein